MTSDSECDAAMHRLAEISEDVLQYFPPTDRKIILACKAIVAEGV